MSLFWETGTGDQNMGIQIGIACPECFLWGVIFRFIELTPYPPRKTWPEKFNFEIEQENAALEFCWKRPLPPPSTRLSGACALKMLHPCSIQYTPHTLYFWAVLCISPCECVLTVPTNCCGRKISQRSSAWTLRGNCARVCNTALPPLPVWKNPIFLKKKRPTPPHTR